MTVRSPRPWTVEEFLAWEREQPERYEFIDGTIRMITGGSHAHGVIKANIVVALHGGLRGTGCRIAVDGPKVLMSDASLYPDVVVSCRPADLQRDIVEEPVVIVEVLSKSTSRADRGPKWLIYQQVPSLQHYVLVAQDERRVEAFTRSAEGWQPQVATEAGDVALPGIRCILSLDDVYEGVLERGSGPSPV